MTSLIQLLAANDYVSFTNSRLKTTFESIILSQHNVFIPYNQIHASNRIDMIMITCIFFFFFIYEFIYNEDNNNRILAPIFHVNITFYLLKAF